MGSTSFGALYKEAKESGALADDVLPIGDFRVELIRANGKENAKNGNLSIGVQGKIVAGEDGEPLDPDDEALNKSAWLNLYFTEKAAPISFRQLKTWGFSDEFLEESESVEQIAEAIVGIVLDVTVTHRTWGDNDENTNMDFKVHAVVTPPAVGGAVVEPDEDEVPAGYDPAEEPF